MDFPNDVDERQVDRRRFLRRAAIAGAAGWTAPVIVSSIASPAGALTCGCTSAAVQIVATCQPNTATSTGCRAYLTNTVNVCRSATDQTVRFSRNAAGTQEPYFDELAVLRVTAPSGTTVVRNFIRWQNSCRDPAGTDVGLTSGNQCGTTAVAAVDITSMFGAECGVYRVEIEIRNGFTPYGWSTAWIVPA